MNKVSKLDTQVIRINELITLYDIYFLLDMSKRAMTVI